MLPRLILKPWVEMIRHLPHVDTTAVYHHTWLPYFALLKTMAFLYLSLCLLYLKFRYYT